MMNRWGAGVRVALLFAVVTATAAVAVSVMPFKDVGVSCGRPLGSAPRGRAAVRVEQDGVEKVVAITPDNEGYYSTTKLPNMQPVTPPRHFVVCEKPAHDRLLFSGLATTAAALMVGFTIARPGIKRRQREPLTQHTGR
jgi:hypothetical protein